MAHRRYVQKKSPASVRGMLGHVPKPTLEAVRASNGPVVWIHAVSVGETIAARPLFKALRDRLPTATLILSNTTDGGHEVARGLLEKQEVDGLLFFPLDLPLTAKRTLKAVQPSALLFVETELWPNLLHQARKRNIATFLVNGRVSENLLASAPRLGPLWHWIVANMQAFLMRNEGDAQRLETLGVPRDQIFAMGDVKLEAPTQDPQQTRATWRSRLGLADSDLLWVAGSTHPGEEVLLLEAFQALGGPSNNLKLALAPRHIHRAQEVAELIREAGLVPRKRSEGAALAQGEVFLLDTVGELSQFYAAGDIAFVGGSLIERGGHNMLEPVIMGVPVLFGPHIMNFRAAGELVQGHHLGQIVKSVAELEAAVLAMVSRDEASRLLFASRVQTAMAPHRGAASRVADHVAKALKL